MKSYTEPNSAMLAYTTPKPTMTTTKFQNSPAVPPLGKLSCRDLQKVRQNYSSVVWAYARMISHVHIRVEANPNIAILPKFLCRRPLSDSLHFLPRGMLSPSILAEAG